MTIITKGLTGYEFLSEENSPVNTTNNESILVTGAAGQLGGVGRTVTSLLLDRGLQRAQAWFDAHGPVTVALLRLVPAARVLISFPAGACKVKPITFEFYTLLGCLTWNIALVYLGLWFGSSWGIVTSYFRDLGLFALIMFAFWTLLRSYLKH